MKELTKAEDQVMQVLWSLKKAFVKEMVEALPEPKPAYNTVSTIVRILEKKGFIGHESFGKSHRYFPLVSKKEYSRFAMQRLIGSYFGGSFEKMVSFFVKENNLDLRDMDEVMRLIDESKDESKDDSTNSKA